MLKREIFRKSFHVLFGTLILLGLIFLGTETMLYALAAFIVIGFTLSLLIMRGVKVPLFKKVVEQAERDNEKHFPGKAAIFFFVSAVLVIVLFKNQPTIILGAISVQVYADTAAALIGIPFGRHKIFHKKSVEGTSACFVVALLCLLVFFNPLIALAGAIVATIIELLPVDDNLWVPIGTAVALRLLL